MTRMRGQRGSVLVEFAFVLPFLAFMAFGVMEFGLVLQDRMTVQTSARTGVRVGSAAGNALDADKSALLGAGAALSPVGLGNVTWILVYKSATADGAIPVACTNPPKAVSGSCNAYTGVQLQQVVAGTAPSSWFGCGAGSLDLSWCPTSRETVQANGTDYMGVWVQANHSMRTGFFGSTVTIGERGVMRLEPQGG